MNTVLTNVYQIKVNNKSIAPLGSAVDSLNGIAEKIIEGYFLGLQNYLISKIQFSTNTNKVEIQFFYYVSTASANKKNRFTKKTFLKSKDLVMLTKDLENLYNKEVKLSINRIHYPYLNAIILSKYLCNNASSNNFLEFTESIFKYPKYYAVLLPYYIVGIKLSLHGRLVTQRQIPRKTTNMKVQGTLSSLKAKITKDTGATTFKNELGQFTLSVEIAQRLGKFHNKKLYNTFLILLYKVLI